MMVDLARVILGVGAVLASLAVVEIRCMPADLTMPRVDDDDAVLLLEENINTAPILIPDDDFNFLHREERYAGSGYGGYGSGYGPGYGGHGSGYGSVPGGSGYGGILESQNEEVTDTPLPTKPEIVQLHVESTVSSRFASTLVTSRLKNVNWDTAEATFTMRLPKDAFISEFSMTIKGVVYHSEVLPKEQAQREYNEAKAKGQTAGQVKQSSSDTTKFVVSVSVASHSSVIFNLTYQQLLRRKDGHFEHRINIQPGQIVPDLRVDVHISEPQGLKEVDASWEMADETEQFKMNAMTTINTKSSGSTAHVHFWANGQTGTVVEGPIVGELVVQYDVTHGEKAGNIQILNGYFVHYFSPEDLPNARKNVVFVIDLSGSMSGEKLSQTKEAFNTILNDVRSIDKFNIVTFATSVSVWEEDSMVEATYENISRAREFVNGMRASGSTNLHGGLMKAIDLIQRSGDTDALPLILMLTDGQPTVGVTNSREITQLVTTAIDGRISLFSIAFGTGADYKFMESLSLHNQGLARQVYADSSASLQMKGFYDEVANPLLFNVRMQYSSDLIDSDSITKSSFMAYYDGTEITVAGKFSEDVYNRVWNKEDAGTDVAGAQRAKEVSGDDKGKPEDLMLKAVISAKSLDADVALNTSAEIGNVETLDSYTVDNFAQRLWAYLTINELLLERKMTYDNSRKQELSARALELSLKYHFVTPLTSLLVVTPQGNATESEEKEEEEDQEVQDQSPIQSQLSGPIFNKGASHTSSADSDPHFLVEIPDSNVTVCFDINGRPGDVFNLLSDPKINLLVSGQVIPAGKQLPDDRHLRTYFGKIGVRLGNRSLVITTDNITVSDNVILPWDDVHTLRMDGFTVFLPRKLHLVISRGDDVAVVVRLHRVHHGDVSERVDYFGVYVERGKGFSEEVHGLLGQFHRNNLHIRAPDDQNYTGQLEIADRSVEVTVKSRRVPSSHDFKDCWHAKHNGKGLIEGVYKNYRLSSLTACPSESKF